MRLLLLLLGAELVQRRWQVLLVVGALWAVTGVAIASDAIGGAHIIRPHYYGHLLLLQGVITLIAGLLASQRRIQLLAKAMILLVPACVIVVLPRHSNMVIAMLIGGVMLLDGSVRILGAWVVRFVTWRMAIAAGAAEIILAVVTLEPWPTWYVGTIGFNVGALLVISGTSTILLANRLRKLPPGAPISVLIGDKSSTALWVPAKQDDAGHDDLFVHVWTPTATGGAGPRRPLIDRYVAAVDARGRVSTGHAALELAPDVYISHYPAVDVMQSLQEFGRALRADVENNVQGRFLPSYRQESEDWCEATEHVRFTRIDRVRVRHFWRAYRRDTAYNLTSRNCSTAVAHALDAALEGALGRANRPWLAVLGAVFTPELWAAGLLRRRAESMTWTPGLVLDYARLLHVVVEPSSVQGEARWWSRVRGLRSSALVHAPD